MTRFLVATASARTTGAACDYLEPRVDEGDEVYVLTVEEGDEQADVGLDDARIRLADATVRTIRRRGTPRREIVALAREKDVDELILGPRRHGATGLGTTARGVVEKVDRPLFVLPAGGPR